MTDEQKDAIGEIILGGIIGLAFVAVFAWRLYI